MSDNTFTIHHTPIIVIGAGPAGLTAAYELAKNGLPTYVFEASNIVGGIARTASYKGYLFDMGGHRFFTKVSLVEHMWKDVLGDELLSRPRISRIYYKGKFFDYPLRPMNALTGLGVFEAFRCGLSYLKARSFPSQPELSFETWVCNRFGRRLFDIFFRTYTEKVWGMSCKEIRADWAAQRIKDLSLAAVVLDALRPRRFQSNKKVIKTLINEFLYPRKGPGMMWERVRDLIEAKGSRVMMNSPVERLRWTPGCVTEIQAGGVTYKGTQFISSMAIRDLIRVMDPPPPPHVVAAAESLRYRDFLTVAVILKDSNLFADNWIYIHDSGVKVGRIQNYKNWSPEMVPDPAHTCLGLEYFCFEHDGLWNMADSDLIALAQEELVQLHLSRPEDFVDAVVVRVPKAYPIYDEGYKQALEVVRDFMSSLPNLQLVGRNGMHRYNNQDHSMLTAILAARNVVGGSFDLWSVNADEEYHESGDAITDDDLQRLNKAQPLIPSRLGNTTATSCQ